ncbi:MAG: hypothetical protein HOP11_08405 [Saprospiraceae bacterium]|nr:hypothetical protein [Saprospiraceae bacterium]
MNWKIIGIVIILGIIGWLVIKNLNKKPDPIPKPVVVTHIDSLAKEFALDSFKFKEKFNNANDSLRSIEVKGIISRIKVDTAGVSIILHSSGVEKAICRMDKDYHNLEADSKVGDTVSIKGLIIKVTDLFILERCSISKN